MDRESYFVESSKMCLVPTAHLPPPCLPLSSVCQGTRTSPSPSATQWTSITWLDCHTGAGHTGHGDMDSHSLEDPPMVVAMSETGAWSSTHPNLLPSWQHLVQLNVRSNSPDGKCAPLSNTWFLVPTWITIPNDIFVSLAVFAQHTVVTNRDRLTRWSCNYDYNSRTPHWPKLWYKAVDFSFISIISITSYHVIAILIIHF